MLSNALERIGTPSCRVCRFARGTRGLWRPGHGHEWSHLSIADWWRSWNERPRKRNLKHSSEPTHPFPASWQHNGCFPCACCLGPRFILNHRNSVGQCRKHFFGANAIFCTHGDRTAARHQAFSINFTSSLNAKFTRTWTPTHATIIHIPSRASASSIELPTPRHPNTTTPDTPHSTHHTIHFSPSRLEPRDREQAWQITWQTLLELSRQETPNSV